MSQEEVAKAVKAMDSQEINGRRLRVRSAADKDKKGSGGGGAGPSSSSQPKKARRELTVNDVTRHLAYAFVGFLERQKAKDGVDDDKKAEFTQAVSLVNSLFDLPAEQTSEDPLKVRSMGAFLNFAQIPLLYQLFGSISPSNVGKGNYQKLKSENKFLVTFFESKQQSTNLHVTWPLRVAQFGWQVRSTASTFEKV